MIILFAPGQESPKIRRRIRALCEKLNEAYPDRKVSGLYANHKKWGETVTELRRLLGYPDNTSFLEAYGYTVLEKNKSGRPTTTDPHALIEELKRRYPNGAGNISLTELRTANPDIPWKTLSINARVYFGTTLVTYLKKIGILG